jgi:hypothetical protein
VYPPGLADRLAQEHMADLRRAASRRRSGGRAGAKVAPAGGQRPGWRFRSGVLLVHVGLRLMGSRAARRRAEDDALVRRTPGLG